MVRSGDVSPATPAPCSRKRTSTARGSPTASHCRWNNQAKKEVLRNSIVFVQIPKGVDWVMERPCTWQSPGGNRDEQHLQFLAELAEYCSGRKTSSGLRSATSSEEVVGMLTAGDGQEVE